MEDQDADRQETAIFRTRGKYVTVTAAGNNMAPRVEALPSLLQAILVRSGDRLAAPVARRPMTEIASPTPEMRRFQPLIYSNVLVLLRSAGREIRARLSEFMVESEVDETAPGR
jgi:hypothetical protein